MNTSVVVGFGQVGKTNNQLDKATTDTNGALYKQYAIPNWPNEIQQDGQYSFTVTREDSTTVGAFSNPLNLTGTGNVGDGSIPVTGGGSYYVDKSGDTLSGIAVNYGTTVNSLLGYNPAIGGSLLIYPGQRVYIPASSSVTPSGQYVVFPHC